MNITKTEKHEVTFYVSSFIANGEPCAAIHNNPTISESTEFHAVYGKDHIDMTCVHYLAEYFMKRIIEQYNIAINI